ncbi:MAG: tRNA (adenosine(37)-N6)-dimethylallyltransferase MiaA [Gemmatimonadaceae bacterium]
MRAEPEDRPVLRAIVGPTAAGKSWLAMALAEAVGATIVSADSRQVYCGFDVGTAKPTADERARVPHVGVDIAEPTQRLSADSWARCVPQWVTEIHHQRRNPLLVGGTGFYLRALFEPFFEAPDVDEEHRRALVTELEKLPLPELRRWCERLDAARAHLGRTQLLRAVEVALLTGTRLSTLHEIARRAPAYAARYLLVDPGGALAGQIARRVEHMLASGWVDEVQRLIASVPADAPAWTACGYGAVREAVVGEWNRDAVVQRVVVETRQYAKRQRTWFRHQLDQAQVTTINPLDADALTRALAWWHGERT